MAWFRKTNPHFWSSEQPQASQPGPALSSGQQTPDGIQPGMRLWPREQPERIELPPAREPNPHLWPRDQPHAPVPSRGHPGPSQQLPGDIQPERRLRPRERHDDVESSRADEPNPHLWPRDQPHAPVPSRGHPGTSQQLPGDIQPDRRLRPRERPDDVKSSHADEPNPHLWPRDQPHAPVPSRAYPGPSQQLPGDIQPERRMRPRDRPDHVEPPLVWETNPHLQPRDQPHASIPSRGHPGPIRQPSQQHPGDIHPGKKKIKPKDRLEPVISRPQPPKSRPQVYEPELELIPTGRRPEHTWPTSQEEQPLHPSQGSHENWPVHPDHVHPPHAHEPVISRPQPPQSRPQAYGPEFIPTDQRTWPTSQEEQPLHPSQASHENWPVHADQPSHEGSSHPRPKHKKQPTTSRPPRKHTPPAGQPSKEHNLIYPPPGRTNPCTWFIAIFCVILWVLVILGGILILIIYLVYRPRNPHFEITNASLNAAYLDMGYLLNADLVVLVNFTNPNVKMNVEFNFVVLKLRYENQPIANQYIQSFSAQKLESKLAAVDMVSSQIRLPVLVTQQLVKQIQKNKVTFEVDGYFHARSRFGSIFRYSYWLYSHCTIITTGPPSGILVSSKCITKR